MKKGDVLICDIMEYNNGFDGITSGKRYTLIETLMSTVYVRITNDYGHVRNYHVRFFKTLNEHREVQLNKLL
jgi:dihydroneopterin aldolase